MKPLRATIAHGIRIKLVIISKIKRYNYRPTKLLMKIIGNFPTLLRSSKRASLTRRMRLRLLFILLWYGSTISFIVLYREQIINLLDYKASRTTSLFSLWPTKFNWKRHPFNKGSFRVVTMRLYSVYDVFSVSLLKYNRPTNYNVFVKLIISIIVNKFISNRKFPDLYQIVKGRNTMTIFGN